LDEYTAESIVLLDSIAAIRKRPGMYVGDTSDGSGLRTLLWELLGNCVDEHLAGRATKVRVTIENRYVTVADDGPGIPVDPMPRGESALEHIFTKLRASGGDKHPHVHIGESMIGLGCVIANALSRTLEVETTRAGRRYRMTFERGHVRCGLEDLGPTESRGTWIRFEPDPEIFGAVQWDFPLIRERIFDMACLNPGLLIDFNGEANHAPDGLAQWVRTHTEAPAIHPIIHLRGERDGVAVEVALQWVDGPGMVMAWASQFRTMEGSHVDGFSEGLAQALAPNLAQDAACERLEPGLVAAIHADIEDPRFGSPTRSRLNTPEAATAVAHVLRTQLPGACSQHPRLIEMLTRRLTPASPQEVDLDEYTAESIVLLDSIAAIRKRPGMYVGDTLDGSGLHRMLWQLLNVCVLEHLVGAATFVSVTVEDETVVVSHNGRGLPVTPIPGHDVSALEAIFTWLSAWKPETGQVTLVNLSLLGTGFVVVNALSRSLEVETHTEGRRVRLAFERGRPTADLVDHGETSRTGSRIRFTPDFDLFERLPWDIAQIRERLWDLACLTPGLAFICNGEVLEAPGGLATWVGQPAVHLTGEHDGVHVEIALRPTETEGRQMGWANRHPTPRGAHIQGLWLGLRDVLAADIAPESIRELLGPGLLAGVHVTLEEPQFATQTLERLDTPQAATAVAHVLRTQLPDVCNQHEQLEQMLERRLRLASPS